MNSTYKAAATLLQELYETGQLRPAGNARAGAMLNTLRKMQAEQAQLAAYRRSAQRLFHDPGRIEIDNSAPISADEPDQGAYVQAWVWVSVNDALDDGLSIFD